VFPIGSEELPISKNLFYWVRGLDRNWPLNSTFLKLFFASVRGFSVGWLPVVVCEALDLGQVSRKGDQIVPLNG